MKREEVEVVADGIEDIIMKINEGHELDDLDLEILENAADVCWMYAGLCD